MTLLNVCVARNVVQCRHYRCLSYTPSGIILDIETVLNTHLIAQRKQKRWNAYSLDECWFLVVIKTKRATQCDTTETIVRDHIQHRRINRHAARLIINYLVALGHQAFATLHSDISVPFSLASRRWAANFFSFPSCHSPHVVGISIFFAHLALRADGAKSACVSRKGPWMPFEWCNIRHSLKYIKIIVPLTHLGKQTSGSRLAEIAQPPARHRTRTSQCDGIP